MRLSGNLHNEHHETIIDRYSKGESSTKIGKDFGVGYQTILNVLRKNDYPIRTYRDYRKFNFNHDYFEKIDSADKAYFLGFILADGYIPEKGLIIALKLSDRHILEKFIKCINGNNIIKEYHNKNSTFGPQSYCRLSLGSYKMAEDLKRLGLHNNKTNVLTVPNIESSLQSHFWRGVFDGDGWLSVYEQIPKRNGKIYESITSAEFGLCGHINTVNSFAEFLDKNKISHGKISKIKTIFRIRTGGNQSILDMCDIFYRDCDAELYLIRKYNNYIRFQRYYNEKYNIPL